MSRRPRIHSPAWPYVAVLAVWLAGGAWLVRSALAAWSDAGAGVGAAIALAITTLAAWVALFYLIGFLAKGAAYLLHRDVARHDRRATPPATAVLYVTAGDFDPAAVDSLLGLESRGPRLFVLHDDGEDAAARARMASFIDAHPRRPEWEVAVWHRPDRDGGKAGAVNWVVERLDPRWELLLLCDCDSIAIDAAALERGAGEFEDPAVAAVQFRNQGHADPGEPPFQRRLARAIDVFDAFATPQALWGYLPFFGHNALLRIADLRSLGGLTPGFFSDDLDYSARLTLSGRRIVYRRDIAFAERHPSDWTAFRKRARKWAFGCMQVVRARAWSVARTPGIPFAHRVGLLEFMGFYPAQALLLAGVLVTHLVLPWLAPAAAGPATTVAGACVVAGLFAPTLAWSLRARRLGEWPALAWACALVYGGSLLATTRGVYDGLSARPRRWVPTNLPAQRPAVTPEGWAEMALGIVMVAVPWALGSAVFAFPAAYVFVATFLLSPLTFAAYRERSAPAASSPARVPMPVRAAGAALLALALGGATAAAGTRITAKGPELRVNGAPFQVRGVHYSPWLPHTGPGGRSPYPEPAVVERDLARIRELGANTLLVHDAPGWLIDRAGAREFLVIYSFSIAWHDTSEAAFARQAAAIEAGIDSLRGHDGVLAWVLGHEVPVWVIEVLGAPAVERRLRHLAERVRARDPGRLLAHANWPPAKQLDLSFLDLACFNLYPAWPYEVSVRGFGPYLREVLVPLAGGRPLIVSEFGINSLEAGEERQAQVLADCWREIERSPVAGGVVFAWCDEWWKNYDNPIPGRGYWERAYDPDDAARHDADPEEHYGIVRSDRTEKPAFAAMRAAWRSAPARRSWTPWIVLGALALGTWLLFGVGRGARRRRETATTARASLGALVLAVAVPAQAAALAWSAADTLSGEGMDDQFGWSAAGAGDLDGDGRPDVAVGARFALVGADTAAGVVYVHRGGMPLGSPAWVRLEGISGHEHFGEGIGGGGDVDGDGAGDLVVGAPLRATGGNAAAGAVDVFRGSPTGMQRWLTLIGEASDDWFGQSVALGDLDGDGYPEIIVGAPYNDRAGSAAGAVFVYRGGPAPATSPWKVMTGSASNEHFGWSVAFLGDFDGDGYGDFAVGARLFGSGLSAARGRVSLYSGGPVMNETADGAWLGEFRDDWFGQSVAGVGDVDGGGRPDLMVGAPYNDRGGIAAGAAYLFRGEDPPGSPPVAIYTGESDNAQLGWSVSGTGDMDGDGRPDLLAGARLQNTPAGSAAGRGYLYSSALPLSAAPISIADGEAANDWFGNAVAGASGYFSAGAGAACFGAPFNDAVASAAGRAHVLGGTSSVAVGPRARASRPMLRIAPSPTTGPALLRWEGSTGPGASFDVLDLAGRRVRRLEAQTDGGGAHALWDGRDDRGRPVRAGFYLVRFAGGNAPPATGRVLVVR